MYKYIGVLFVVGFFSCTNDTKTDGNNAKATEQVASGALPVSFSDAKIQGVYNDYLVLKNALVDTKFKEAGNASKALATKLSTVEGCENTALIATKIVGAKNIEEQRKHFTYLSSDVIAMFKHADLKKGIVYVQHCPMANHGDGGDWLSSNKQIQNPYYGSEMMECGGVIEELKPAK